jgi:hypothetical protein
MPLLQVILVLIAVGVLVFLVGICPWIDATWKQIIKWVAIVGTAIWICGLFGLWGSLSNIHIGRHV